VPFTDRDIQALLAGCHRDPFSVLGPHRDRDGVFRVRVFQPGAATLEARTGDGTGVLAQFVQRHPAGLFEAALASPDDDYRLLARWQDGTTTLLDDPYRHPLLLAEADLWWFNEGTLLRPHRVLGAELIESRGISGTRFAVWAPHATSVSIVGDFNFWDDRRHPMRLRQGSGIWEIFLPDVGEGALYKFSLRDNKGQSLGQKADPFARRAEYRPATASVVTRLPAPAPALRRRHANAVDAPISIYEVHAPSWRLPKDPGRRFADWDELASTLVPYAADLGFTHIELMPVSEYPFDASWGYQPTALYAPSARFGDPSGLGRFVAACHHAGLGLIIDWVPGHFPSDAHGLARFDGSALYEYADPREGFHPDWNTLIYDFAKPQVSNFLIGSALYWLETWGVDGLRIDAVASMLHRDYSRREGEWLPNVRGGRENLEAIAFLRRLHSALAKECPDAITIAEESTTFPRVSRPVAEDGLGFNYKWNMGWMNDSLRYIAREPAQRRYHHNEMTFGLMYAFSEHFVLAISHDEVVHGKRSLLERMPGDEWQRFATLRAYLGFMFGHPGKKLLFMGCEFAQIREWNYETELDWHLLERSTHSGVQHLVRDLNRLLREKPALHRRDFDPAGFQWIDVSDHERSVFAFLRREEVTATPLIVVSHFTTAVHEGYRLGVPEPGVYRECLNTDSEYYGGTNVGTTLGKATSEPVPAHGYKQSIVLRLPPLATVFIERMT
jgi:1,4-alpha-glucan branching enzyme